MEADFAVDDDRDGFDESQDIPDSVRDALRSAGTMSHPLRSQ